MGDAADYLTETGRRAWLDHLAGDCDEWCEYCEEEREDDEDYGHDPDDDVNFVEDELSF